MFFLGLKNDFLEEKILFGLPNSMGNTFCAPGGVGDGEIVKKKSVPGFHERKPGAKKHNRFSLRNIWGSPDFTWKHKTSQNIFF